MNKITLGMGCFWCTEAIFQQLKGVENVTSGYSGGEMDNPSYDDISTGETGHAEVTQIEFNPDESSLKDLLYVFFHIHNPTTRNRQGADIGSQYRSVIFYHDEEQKKIAKEAFAEAQNDYDEKIVTEIAPFITFYPAEKYHQDYYKNNQDFPYCQIVIDPKIQKLKKIASDKMKS